MTMVDLRRLVLTENKVVTSKSLCFQAGVSAAESKKLLQRFVDEQKADEVDVLFLLSGLDMQQSYKFQIVNMTSLDSEKASFSKLHGSHVYSVSAKKGTSGNDDLISKAHKTDKRVGDRCGRIARVDHKWSSVKLSGADGLDSSYSAAPQTSKSSFGASKPKSSFGAPKSFGSSTTSGASKSSSVFGNSKKRKALDTATTQGASKKVKTAAGFFGKQKKADVAASKANPPAAAKPKKKGLMGFFTKGKKTDPFKKSQKKGTSSFGAEKVTSSFGAKKTSNFGAPKSFGAKKSSAKDNKRKAVKAVTKKVQPNKKQKVNKSASLNSIAFDNEESESEDAEAAQAATQQMEEDEEEAELMRQQADRLKAEAEKKKLDEEQVKKDAAAAKFAAAKKLKDEEAARKKAEAAEKKKKLASKKKNFFGAATKSSKKGKKGKSSAKASNVGKVMKTVQKLDENGMMVFEDVWVNPGGGPE